MRSGRHKQGQVVSGDDAGELVQQRSDHRLPGLRPGDIADGDGNALTGSHDLPKRRSGHRVAERVLEGGGLVGCGRRIGGRHHRRPVSGQMYPESVPAIQQVNAWLLS